MTTTTTRRRRRTRGVGIGRMGAAALLGLVTLQAARPTSAGTIQTQAVCQEQFGWMDNALEQSPCLIAAFLLGACTDGSESPLALFDLRCSFVC